MKDFIKEVCTPTVIGVLMLILPPLGVFLAVWTDNDEGFDGFS